MRFTRLKTRYSFHKWRRLAVASLSIGFLAAFLAIVLKHLTEHYENLLFAGARRQVVLTLLFPILGLSLIYLLKQQLFKNKENKGIREIYESLAPFGKLPAYKIPSHFVNGFLTVVFGGSTGIEVSTVVASAAIGSSVRTKQSLLGRYRRELICAGIAAGITALFNSPVAGILFTFEVISRERSKERLVTVAVSSAAAWLLLLAVGEKPFLEVSQLSWNYAALPYFVVLGVFAALNSVYLTRCVLFFKRMSSRVPKPEHRIALGGSLLGLSILILPQLYGDSYHALSQSIIALPATILTVSVALTVIGILLLKPVMASVTLASGGDGGVFAPSLITGAFAGLLVALIANRFLGAHVIPLNFMLVGMAAVLSATIHAPFTAVFLICGLVSSYTLLLPLLAVCLISKYCARYLFPYTVYNYKDAS